MSFYGNGDGGEIIFGDIRISRADRQPCLVCGHPTGDCTSQSHEPPKRILLQGSTPSLEAEQTFYVEEDVIEERRVSDFMVVNIILARKGTSIPLSRARELGLF